MTIENKLIKICFEGFIPEFVWAEQIGKRRARVANIPCFVEDVSLWDIVQIDRDNKFVRLISKGSYKSWFKYKQGKTKEETQEIYNGICECLKKKEADCESMVVGSALIALPISMTIEDARRLLNSIPTILEHGLQFDCSSN